MTEAPVICRRCGAANRPGVSFCAQCGQPLVGIERATVARPGTTTDSGPCPRCGAQNRVGAAFCSECGFNIRLAVAPAGGTEPMASSVPDRPAAPSRPTSTRAWLGPIVLGVAAAGLGTAWALPFAFGDGSLGDQALGPGGFGLAFWTAYPGGGFLEATYFGVVAPLPVLIGLLIVLSLVGVVRGLPGRGQRIGLLGAMAWCAAVAVLFVVVEVGSGLGGGLIELMRGLSPAGLIASMAAAIGVIGGFTRLAGG